MPAVAREGDQGQGTCNGPGHPAGKSVTITLHGNSGVVTENGTQLCLANCTGTASCGHTSNANSGSSTANVNGVGLHRVGDTGTLPGGGTYSVVSGSGIITSN